MVVVIFKIVLRSDLDAAAYEAEASRMVELVSAMPGFVGMDYAPMDGGELLVARFESHEALHTWREHPEHRAAQERGRNEFFQHYRIEVCDEVRSYEFSREGEADTARGDDLVDR
jgi:heme-degrading monooxygenase HmoA